MRTADMDRPFSPRFSAELCMVVLSSGPNERSLYQPVCDYLFEQCCTPIEVRSPGEALIHTRHATFSLIIMPDDDHELIKKIKAPDNLNNQSILIATSCAEVLPASTQDLIDSKLIQQVVHKTSDTDKFQTELLAAVKYHLWVLRHDGNNFPAVGTNPSSMEAFPATTPQTITTLQDIPGIQGMYRQGGFLPHGGSYLPTTGQVGEFPMLPLQPYTLFPPMVVSYASIAPGRGQPTFAPEGSMMPRIVNFGNIHDQSFLNLLGQQPSVRNACTVSCQDPGTNQQGVDCSSSDVPAPPEDSRGIEQFEDNRRQSDNDTGDSKGALPGIKKFLEALGPGENESPETKAAESNEESDEEESCRNLDESKPKKARMETRSKPAVKRRKRLSGALEAEGDHGTEKSPLSVPQTRPYFLKLDEYMERMAFDPKVKPAERHNAKERHRRVRITKAAEFFKDTLPCMDPNMDKASVFHIAVYYLIYLRNALRQHDPALLKTLHKTYRQEWEAYFDMEKPIE